MTYSLTEKRRAWLEQLRDHGPACRARNNIGYCCMQAGWTEWYAEFKDGRQMPMSEARKLYPGPEAWDMFKSGQFRECITSAGLAALQPFSTNPRNASLDHSNALRRCS